MTPLPPDTLVKMVNYSDRFRVEDEGAVAGVCDKEDGEGLIFMQQSNEQDTNGNLDNGCLGN